MPADVGAADPALLAALQLGDPTAIAAGLTSARLLVAVIAMPGAEHASEGEMALALLESADGRQALPAFTSIDTLASWSAQARPVPRPGSEVIAYALEQQLAAVVIDPGTPHAWTLLADELVPPSPPAFGPPAWKPSRKARRRAAPHEVYAVSAVAGEDRGPLIAVICPDGTLDADWAQRLLERCPEGTGVLALPPSGREAARQVGVRLA